MATLKNVEANKSGVYQMQITDIVGNLKLKRAIAGVWMIIAYILFFFSFIGALLGQCPMAQFLVPFVYGMMACLLLWIYLAYGRQIHEYGKNRPVLIECDGEKTIR